MLIVTQFDNHSSFQNTIKIRICMIMLLVVLCGVNATAVLLHQYLKCLKRKEKIFGPEKVEGSKEFGILSKDWRHFTALGYSLVLIALH
jgi:hypothetical protein